MLNLFLKHVATTQNLHYKKQFAVYHSDTLVTLKQCQGHQTWCALVDPKQSRINVELKKKKKTRLNSVHKKANVKAFCNIRKHVSYLP